MRDVITGRIIQNIKQKVAKSVDQFDAINFLSTHP